MCDVRNAIARRNSTQLMRKASEGFKSWTKSSLVEAALTSAVPIIVDFCMSTESWNHPGRESTLQSVHRQIKARDRILVSYRRVKNELKTLQDRYVSSKDNHNIFARYTALKRMIKEVSKLEKEWWTLLDVPKQELSESQSDYVSRVLIFLDQRLSQEAMKPPPAKGGISGLLGATTAQFTEKSRDAAIYEKLKGKSTDELRKENLQVQADICKLVKKYSGLRGLVHQLKVAYESTNNYPIIPRYTMLKDMVKDVLRDSAFSEVCHEVEIE